MDCKETFVRNARVILRTRLMAIGIPFTCLYANTHARSVCCVNPNHSFRHRTTSASFFQCLNAVDYASY